MPERTHAPYGRLAPGRGNRNEGTRQHNLSTILSWVHHQPGVTRAELTRMTGLNRSTVGAMVAELQQGGLVYEGRSLAHGVGRPSPEVHPSESVIALAVNPDVDAITLGAVSLGGFLLSSATRECDSPPSVDEFLMQLPALIDEALAPIEVDRVVGIAVAVPGLVRRADGSVVRAPHLDWNGVPLRDRVAAVTGLPVYVENDATSALVAESIFGGARGIQDVVYLNGSASGIGGAVLGGGTVMAGSDGFAGELGHLMVNSAGDRCHCGRRGCLESEVNLPRLHAAARVRRFGPGGLERHLHLAGEGELAAEVDRQVDMLAVGIANLVTVFNPSHVLLGGFLGTLWAARDERLESGVRRAALRPMADGLMITRARLREDLLPVGAAELAFAPLLRDPAAVIGV